jgi:prophage regulatory protein
MEAPPEKISILRLPQLRVRTGLSRSTIYALVKSGALKAPISLGARAVGWLSTDVDDYINSRIALGRPNLPHFSSGHKVVSTHAKSNKEATS